MAIFEIGIGLILFALLLLFAYVVYLRIDYYLMVKEHEKAKVKQEEYFRQIGDS